MSENIQEKTEVFIGENWYTISEVNRQFDKYGKPMVETDLMGRSTMSQWNYRPRVAETRPNGSMTKSLIQWSEELTFVYDGEVLAHYTYASFGDCTVTGTLAQSNPWRFSSEYADDEMALIYYNYRYYDSFCGRWINRDCTGESNSLNLTCLVDNNSIVRIDYLGLVGEPGTSACGTCGADASDWILEELQSQIEGWENWKKKNSTRLWGSPKEITIMDYLKWANGNQRYKDPDYFAFSKGTKCGTQPDSTKPGCGRSVTLCGKCVRSSILGNIMYGFLGGYQGYSTNQLINAATGVKQILGMKVDTYDESASAFGSKLFDRCGRNITLDKFCEVFNQMVAECPQALRESNENGGYNDYSSCVPCKEKTKETRHGGADGTRFRP